MWRRVISYMDVVCVCVCLSSELFQLVAVHLPRSGDQEVEARELSIVLCDVSPHPGAASFGREVHVIGLYFMYQVLQ